MKVAIVHDYFKEFGGAERVVLGLLEVFPDADLYGAFSSIKSGSMLDKYFGKKKIKTTFLQYFPWRERYSSWLRIFLPCAWRRLDFSNYDLVISSSASYCAHWIRVKKPARHICYCHTPARYLWGLPTAKDWSKYGLLRPIIFVINHFMRVYDYYRAQEVDVFIANSENVRERIKKFYRREAKVVYPPIKMTKDNPLTGGLDDKNNYFLTVGRLSREKHVNIIIEACGQLGKELVVVGDGKEKEILTELKNKYHKLIELTGEVSEEKLNELYKNCKAFIFCGEEEDFGMVVVEAQMYGKPVIALNQGGVQETVINDVTGILFNKPTVEDLKKAITKFNQWTRLAESKQASVLNNKIQNWAQKFSAENFHTNITNIFKI